MIAALPALTDPQPSVARSRRGRTGPVRRAAVALRGRSESDVARAVRVCAELGVPVVPRGAGTDPSGGANAVDGCPVLDASRKAAVVEVD